MRNGMMFVDFASTPPLPQFTRKSEHLKNYRRVYKNSEAQVADSVEPSLDSYLSMYVDLGADKVVLKARDNETTFGFRVSNEDVSLFCRDHSRFVGLAAIDPHKGSAAVAEFERAIRELGLKGLNLQCFEHRLAPNDRRLYPLYSKCIELDVPVNIHCGTNFSLSSSMEFGRPILLDDVMNHFPELRVCASPPGWPWVHELIAVAWRHPNLWIGLVAVRPRLLSKSGSGYEPLLTYGSTILRDRIIFGSSFPMIDVRRSYQELEDLGLSAEVLGKWRGKNAATFLGLDEYSAAN
jgi:predicted TIM-barrel fold metal-dependent hydrolase